MAIHFFFPLYYLLFQVPFFVSNCVGVCVYTHTHDYKYTIIYYVYMYYVY